MDLCARAHRRLAARPEPVGRGLYRLARELCHHSLPRLRPCDTDRLRTLSAVRVRQAGAAGRGHAADAARRVVLGRLGIGLAAATVLLPCLALVAAVLLFVIGVELVVVAAVVALLVLLALGLAALV